MSLRERWSTARGLSRAVRTRVRLSAARLTRTSRAVLTRVGLPIRKEFLVLRCGEGEEASGLFSEVAAVIGALEHYERWSGIYAGIRVDFRDQGLYHDPATGDNWWEYFFEPVSIGSPAHAATKAVAPLHHDAFANRVEERMSRRTAAAILDRHIRVKASLRQDADRFLRETFNGARVVGVHYRGTDKIEDTPRVPFDTVLAAIHDVLRPEGPEACPIFLATDDQGFLDHARRAFPGNVYVREMPRSVDGSPIHKTRRSGYMKGVDAVMDCLLLSRCQHLIRTPSNLSLFSTLFNPDLPVTMLEGSRERP